MVLKAQTDYHSAGVGVEHRGCVPPRNRKDHKSLRAGRHRRGLGDQLLERLAADDLLQPGGQTARGRHARGESVGARFYPSRRPQHRVVTEGVENLDEERRIDRQHGLGGSTSRPELALELGPWAFRGARRCCPCRGVPRLPRRGQWRGPSRRRRVWHQLRSVHRVAPVVVLLADLAAPDGSFAESYPRPKPDDQRSSAMADALASIPTPSVKASARPPSSTRGTLAASCTVTSPSLVTSTWSSRNPSKADPAVLRAK